MADKQSQIAFDELLSLVGGNHLHAGWLAMQLANGSGLEEVRGLYQTAVMNLEKCRQSFADGDSQAVLTALNLYVSIFHFPPPAWVTEATWTS